MAEGSRRGGGGRRGGDQRQARQRKRRCSQPRSVAVSSPLASIRALSPCWGGHGPPRFEESTDDFPPKTRAALAAVLAATLLVALLPSLAARAGAGLLEPHGRKVYFGVSDTGDPAQFGEFSTAVAQAPGGDRVLPHLGQRLPRLDRTLADGAGAADAPHHHRRQPRRARADHPAGDRPGRRRRLPGPPQPALLGEADARLRAPAGRAQPLPQRLRLLRLRRQPPRRRPQPRAGTGSPSAAST